MWTTSETKVERPRRMSWRSFEVARKKVEVALLKFNDDAVKYTGVAVGRGSGLRYSFHACLRANAKVRLSPLRVYHPPRRALNQEVE